MQDYILQTQSKPGKGVAVILRVLGCGDVTSSVFKVKLTGKQVERLKLQPWIGSLNVEGRVKPLARRPVVIREPVPQSNNNFGIFTHKKPTRSQSDILFLLGCDLDDGKVFVTELTPVQVERLQEQKWVKSVAPEVQFHTCNDNDASTEAE